MQKGETVSLLLSYPMDFAGQPVVAESLDGGTLKANQLIALVKADATVDLSFTAGTQPGLYRIAVRAGDNLSLLRFWVLDPDNPAAQPAVLTPSN